MTVMRITGLISPILRLPRSTPQGLQRRNSLAWEAQREREVNKR